MVVLDGLVVYLICAWGGGEETLGKEAWGLVPHITWLVFATYLAVCLWVVEWLEGTGTLEGTEWREAESYFRQSEVLDGRIAREIALRVISLSSCQSLR